MALLYDRRVKTNASITIRRLDPRLKSSLKKRAAAHGRSMEAEAREILSEALSAGPVQPQGDHWFAKLRRRLDGIGYIDGIEIPPRGDAERDVDFSAPEFDPADA